MTKIINRKARRERKVSAEECDEILPLPLLNDFCDQALNNRIGCTRGSSFFPDSPFIFNLMKTILPIGFFLFQIQGFAQKPYQVIAYYTGDGEKIRNYPVHLLDQIIYSFLTLRNDSLSLGQKIQGALAIFPFIKIIRHF